MELRRAGQGVANGSGVVWIGQNGIELGAPELNRSRHRLQALRPERKSDGRGGGDNGSYPPIMRPDGFGRRDRRHHPRAAGDEGAVVDGGMRLTVGREARQVRLSPRQRQDGEAPRREAEGADALVIQRVAMRPVA